jgi:hypothetical protein
MARTVVIELPDDLEQQLVSQAEQLNLSLETVVLRSLTQTLNPPLPTVQQTLVAYVVIAETLTRIREAKLAGQTITLHLAQVMKEGGTIRDFEIVKERDQQLLIHLQPQPISEDRDRSTLEVNQSDLPQELQSLLQNLSSEDPNARVNAVVALGELYSDTRR